MSILKLVLLSSLCLFLAACGSSSGTASPNPEPGQSQPPNSDNPPFVHGYYLDTRASFSACGQTGQAGFEIELFQIEGKPELTGSVNYYLGAELDFIEGSFKGYINNSGLITGKVHYLNIGFPVDLSLQYSSHKIQGEYKNSVLFACQGQEKPSETILSTTLLPPANDNLEFNNSFYEASSLNLPFEHNNLIMARNDIDWYHIDIDEAQKVDIKTLTSSGLSLSARFYNKEYKDLRNTLYFSSHDPQTVFLQVGNYYLKFDTQIKDLDKTYGLNITGTPLIDAEFEPNDSFEDAKALELDTDYIMFLYPSDEDWFKFELGKGEAVRINASINFSDLNFELFDANKQLITAESFFNIDSFSRGLNLDKGLYYVRFPNNGTEFTVPISIANYPTPDSNYEYNNIPEKASPIELDTHLGSLHLFNQDKDWYSFNLDQAQDLVFKADRVDCVTISLNLYDDKLNKILPCPETGGEPFGLRLAAGNYLLLIEANANEVPPLKELIYSLSTELPKDSFEPNNTFSEARALTLNQTQQAHIYPGDNDWFKFQLSKAQIIQVDLSNLTFDVQANLLDSQGKRLFNLASGEKLKQNLAAGNYYLEFFSAFDSAYYSFAVTGTTVPDSAQEPNNTKAMAFPISLNQNYPFVVSENDTDWFSFKLATQTTISIDFSHLTQQLGDFVFEISSPSLLNEIGEPILMFAGDRASFALQPDTYHIRIDNPINVLESYFMLKEETLP